jgi:voltage-gated potassium channel
MTFQQACYYILAPASEATHFKKASRLFDFILVVIITVNIAAMMIETVPDISQAWLVKLRIIEIISVILFAVEYSLRVYSSAAGPNVSGGSSHSGSAHNTTPHQAISPKATSEKSITPWQKRWHYIKSPMAIIDLMAILPFFLSMFLVFDLRILRIFRVLRILKIGRYSRSIQTLVDVVRSEAHSLFAALSVLMLFTVIAATCIYYIEHNAQPDVFSSIPASLWWAVVTLTTVGYGDAVPITSLGKLFGGFITIMGICFYALPAGILSSSYTGKMQLKRDRFKDTVRTALDDGVLSEHDAHHIERVRGLLDLDEEEAHLIIRLLQHHHNGKSKDE